jgi:hypothetical protein
VSASAEIERLRARVDSLEDALLDVALLADGHRRSRACDETGANIALSVVLARAASALGRSDELRERGALLACGVDRPTVEA